MIFQPLTRDTRRLRLRVAALSLIFTGAAHAATASAAPNPQAPAAAVAAASFSVGSCLVTEDPSGLTSCNFVVTLASPSSTPLELTYQTGSSGNLLGPNAEASLEDPLVGSESQIFGTGSLLGTWLVESGNVELKSWMTWQPAHYRQSLDMHGDTAGTIGRDIDTQPSQQYVVSFALSGHPICANAVTTMSAYFGSELLGDFSFDSTGNSVENMGWRYESVMITATTSTTRLRFASTAPGGCGPALDDLAVSPVGVASSGIDFVPAWRHHDDPLVLPAGATTHTIAVNVIGDTLTEGFEDFELSVCIASLGCEAAFGGINEGTPDVMFRNGFEPVL